MAGQDGPTKDGHILLREDVSRLFSQFFSDVLGMLELRFPHRKGDGSQNETVFRAMRGRILRGGNDKIRALDEIFSDYLIVQTRETKREKVVVGTQVRKGNQNEREEKS